MASLFWVGGSTAYDGVTNRLATTSGGSATVAVIGATDTVTFDGNSPASAVVTTSAQIDCATLTLLNPFTGSLTLSNPMNTTGVMTLSRGTLNTNDQNCQWGTFNSSNGNSRTLTLGSSTITITGGSATVWDCTTSTGYILNSGTSTILFTGATVTTQFGSAVYNNVTFTGGGTLSAGSFASALRFNNFTYTGTAVKTDGMNLGSAGTLNIDGTFTLTGQSITNRIFLRSSSTAGLLRDVDCDTVAFTNVDVRDVNAISATPWTGTSMGDAGGNVNITFDTPVTRYGVVAGNWSDTATWSTDTGGAGGASVPLTHDPVILDGGSAAGTYAADMPRLGAGLDMTNFTRTFANNTLATQVNGDLTIGAGATISGTQNMTLGGRGSHGITTSGKTITWALVFQHLGGTYTLQDSLTTNRSTAGAITFNSGTVVLNNKDVTMTGAAGSVVGNNAEAVVDMGSGTFSIGRNSAAEFWNIGSAVITNAANSTIRLTATTTNSRTFAGGGEQYGILRYTLPKSTGSLVITGNNTFTNIQFADNANARTLSLTAGTITQITGGFDVVGTPGRLMTVNSSTGGTAVTLSRAIVDSQGNIWKYQGFPELVFNANSISLPGTNTARLELADTAALSITGDLDVRIKVALTDWTPAATGQLIAKWRSTGTSRSWRLIIGASGAVQFGWSTTGADSLTATSTVNPTVTDGQPIWIRCTMDVDNGASGRTVTFYTSDDGIVWTQLGSAVTTSGVTSLFDNATELMIGSADGSTAPIGNFYQAEVRNGIGGSIVADPNFTKTPIQTDYLSYQDAAGSGEAVWYAGINSTNVSGNTGLVFNTGRNLGLNRTAAGARTGAVNRSTATRAAVSGGSDYI